MARNILKKLDTYSKNDLPSCYESVNDWLFDFYPDLPWDPGARHSLEWLTTNPEAIKVIEQFSKRVKFDMMYELKQAMED
jgi:hypothetical protein